MEFNCVKDLESFQYYKASTKDDNFCVLVAIHTLTDIPLKELDYLANKYVNRKFRCGMTGHQIKALFDKSLELGLHLKEGSYTRKNRTTVSRFIKDHPKGRYLIGGCGHAFTIIDGVVNDFIHRPRRHIIQAWRVYTTEELRILMGLKRK